MSFFRNMFGTGRTRSTGPSSQMHSQLSSGMTQQLAHSQNTTRRELLRVVLRDTLNRHGIPTNWLTAELLTTTSRTGERGIHWRLVVKHWDARLLEHSVALQNALVKRVLTFDPLAVSWLNGVSWQMALEDESMCPPLPPPPTWTLSHRPATEAHAAPSGDVIEGPVRIATEAPQADVKAELEELLKIRDEDFRRHAGDGDAPGNFAKTEPAKL